MSDNMKKRAEETGSIALSDWTLNAQATDFDSDRYETEDRYQHFLSAIRPTVEWIELD